MACQGLLPSRRLRSQEASVRVRKLDTERAADVRGFVRFPFDLYRNCSLWVPPLVSDMETVLNRRMHPFFLHSTADFFAAEDERAIVGRIAVFNNRHYNQYRGSKTAFFYYFDAVEDVAVARALFAAACDWARTQGCDEMIGPKGPGAGDGIGLLVHGFDHRPAMGIPYNYPYYERLVLDSSFEKRGDLVSGYLPRDNDLPQRFYDLAERIKSRRGFWVKSFASKREGRQWIPRIGQVLNASFVDTQDYYPVTDEEIARAAEQLLTVADPRMIKLVMLGDEVVGFVFAFPDLSEAIQRAGGRLFPFGWFHVLREFKRTKWVNVNGLGLVPQHRGMGANVLLYTELAKTLRDHGFEHADIVQVGEENIKSLAEMQALGVSWYKTHRVYRQSLE
jgi:GNAT superfamily N-acetyltransferase